MDESEDIRMGDTLEVTVELDRRDTNSIRILNEKGVVLVEGEMGDPSYDLRSFKVAVRHLEN
ncbi:hypothetical protein [Streptomyces sp. MST-110588]|uniref:hypothetical protein n=1 Tax=Streptomyces sp. MST-110588 TaxID=2833628 RepID=UPI001F5D858E|nr:hypothetical protein [Streptomyces sp. MST-110588]UNO41192.1 hypothetical protein KGS77_18450 [Streptomyces sp. MST-110588]